MRNDIENKSESYQPLSVVTGPRQRILTSESFLSIGQLVGASKFKLAIRIPGDKKPKLLIIDWENGVPIKSPTPTDFDKLGEPIIEEVLRSGTEIIQGAEHRSVTNARFGRLGAGENIQPFAAIPILYQGTVTGCVCFWSQDKHGFKLESILKIREFVLMAALVAQWEREMSAADEFSSSSIRWRVESDVMNNSKAIREIADSLLDKFSSLAVIIDLNIGFRRYIELAGEINEAEELLDNLHRDIPIVSQSSASSMEIIEAKLLGVFEEENNDEKDRLPTGKVYFVNNKSKDSIMTQGSSYSSPRATASLATDALLNAIRDGLHALLRDFGIALNKRELLTFDQWFDNIEKTAKNARLLWAAATNSENNEIHGKDEYREIVQACLNRIELDPKSGQILRLEGLEKKFKTASPDIDLMMLDDPLIGKHTILSVNLPSTKARIWFGVERNGFGAELTTLSPWFVFIDRLADIADAALYRLKTQQVQLEAAETRNLATYAVTSHTVFHQMANMVRDISNPITSIKEALAVGVLKANQDVVDLVNSSVKSAEGLLDFASTFMNVNKMDTCGPCSLVKVINESKDLFDLGLKNNKIRLDVNISDDINVDVPFNVAFLSIANLLSNAKDAIGKRGGRIWIEAENVGDMIHCYVMNDGPQVDPAIKDKIFRKIGVSTKEGRNVRGWGLYLAYRSLIENRGYIELTSSIPGETKFTIRFPRVRQEII